MTQIQVGSPEQRLARWMIYAVLAAPLVATLLHDLGVGAVAPWIIYAILVAPMIVMLSHREIERAALTFFGTLFGCRGSG
jgi:hypothetical protein